MTKNNKGSKINPHSSSINTLVHRMVCGCGEIPANSKLPGGTGVTGEVSDSVTQRWKDGSCGWATSQRGE